MQTSGIPYKTPHVFASSAAGSLVSSPIPDTVAGGAGHLSWQQGIPSECMTLGGIPPFGAEVNALYQQMSAWSQWQQAGGPVFYDSTFSSEIGGYPKGAVLAVPGLPSAYYISTVENNTSAPPGSTWLVSRIPQMQTGSGTITSGSIAITFAAAFSAAPKVVVTDDAANTWNANNFSVYGVTSVTASGFTLVGLQWNGTSFAASASSAFNWIAVL